MGTGRAATEAGPGEVPRGFAGLCVVRLGGGGAFFDVIVGATAGTGRIATLELAYMKVRWI